MDGAAVSALAAEAVTMEITVFDQTRTPGPRTPTYRVLRGRLPIVLSAPHAVQQPRAVEGVEGILHRSEPYTGPLAIQLHRATGAWAIYATRTARRDPNHAPFSPYKRYGLRALLAAARPGLVLDLHGSQSREFAVAVGTAPSLRLGRAQGAIDLLVAQLQRALDGAVVVDPPGFQANGAGTVTAHCWAELGVPAMQLEISRAYRSPRQHPAAYAAIFAALCDIVAVASTFV